MKTKLIVLSALIPLAASAEIDLVAGWDFGQFAFDGYAITSPTDFTIQTFIPSNFSGANNFNPTETHDDNDAAVSSGRGTINWSQGAADAQQVYGSASGSGTSNVTMVDFAGTSMSNGFSDPVGNALVFENFSTQSFTINVNLTDYIDFTGSANLSFAAFADAPIVIDWLINGTPLTTNVAGTGAYAVYTVDLPGSAYGTNAVITATITGNAKLGIDNLQINGEYSPAAVPEPSTYAALAGVMAVAVAGLRRRRS